MKTTDGHRWTRIKTLTRISPFFANGSELATIRAIRVSLSRIRVHLCPSVVEN